DIDRLSKKGQGVGSLDVTLGPDKQPRTLEVEVRRTLPGDRVETMVEQTRHNQVSGRIARLIEPSPLRRPPRCQHFGQREHPNQGCGGCALQFVDYADQLVLKHEQVTRALRKYRVDAEVAPTIGLPDPWYYRNKMEFSFAPGPDDEVMLGLFPLGWHRQVLDLQECY